ncbi:MAG: hypothetical protein NT075_29850, partial [Chloroflexi bacterium]|nr:hypothetical protein [Chloroflexota bacterium]
MLAQPHHQQPLHDAGNASRHVDSQQQQRDALAISDALNLTTIRSNALEATLNGLTSGVYL